MSERDNEKAMQDKREKAALEYQCQSHPGKEYFNRAELQHCFHAAWNACCSEISTRLDDLMGERQYLRVKVAELEAQLSAQVEVIACGNCVNLESKLAAYEAQLKVLREALIQYRHISLEKGVSHYSVADMALKAAGEIK